MILRLSLVWFVNALKRDLVGEWLYLWQLLLRFVLLVYYLCGK
jgi:hypothetical protein